MAKRKIRLKLSVVLSWVKPKVLKKLIIKKGASSYHINSIFLPKDAEFKHIMVTGTTGSGKSNMIHGLLQQIRQQGDQAIVVDTTGGIFSRFYDEKTDLLLNPLDSRSQRWNLWKECGEDAHILDEIAQSLIPDSKSYDSFWNQSSRQVLVESINYLTGQNTLSYQELLNMVLNLDLDEFSKRLKATPAASLVDPIIDKTALSIRATMAPYLKIFKNLEDTKNGFAILPFIAQITTKQWLFLSCPPHAREFLKPIFSTFLSLVIKGLMMRQENNNQKTG
jgi:type IV secretory pathway TraG/TraD family ATPase VirD4